MGGDASLNTPMPAEARKASGEWQDWLTGDRPFAGRNLWPTRRNADAARNADRGRWTASTSVTATSSPDGPPETDKPQTLEGIVRRVYDVMPRTHPPDRSAAFEKLQKGDATPSAGERLPSGGGLSAGLLAGIRRVGACGFGPFFSFARSEGALIIGSRMIRPSQREHFRPCSRPRSDAFPLPNMFAKGSSHGPFVSPASCKDHSGVVGLTKYLVVTFKWRPSRHRDRWVMDENGPSRKRLGKASPISTDSHPVDAVTRGGGISRFCEHFGFGPRSDRGAARGKNGWRANASVAGPHQCQQTARHVSLVAGAGGWFRKG